MPLTRRASARECARTSTTAAPLPPDAPALLRAIESSADTAAHFVPAECVGMLVLVSKAMRAVLQKARLPASVQVCHIGTPACYACLDLHPSQQTHMPTREQTATTASGQCIAQGLKHLSRFSTITEFHYSAGSQSLHMPASLAKALQCQRLSVLCLASANMRNPATGHLASVVEACETLQHLDISRTLLGDALMLQLAPVLGKHRTLESLDLTMCWLGTDGAHWLSGIFQPALKILKLSNNNVRRHTSFLCGMLRARLAERPCCFADA